jgi:hypothetical protein
VTSPPPSVSGPGALSRRTDRGTVQKLAQIPDAAYGEQKTFVGLQRDAPLAQVPSSSAPTATAPSRGAAPGGGPGLADLLPLDAPSARPGEPVTAGADAGAGPGSAALGLPSGGAQAYQTGLSTLAAVQDANPEMKALFQSMQARGL